MSEPIPPELVDYMRHLKKLEFAGESTTLKVGPVTAMVLIGTCQWATRNPNMPAEQREILRSIVDQLRPLFAGTLGEEIINKGGHPEWDVREQDD